MADSGAKSVSELLSAFFDHEMAAKGASYSGFGRAWKSIAGTRLGEHSRPADIRHGILIVEAEHQGWMQLLQLQQDRILEEIGRRFPELEIRGIAFRLSRGDFARPEEAKAPESADGGAPAPVAPASTSASVPPTPPAPKEPTAAEAKNSLPPEILAMFSRIRKNAKQ
ncbi:DUF721 domain-containing protein [bacterium]|nr:DUF721 domain-containing protein [bacterium]